MKKHYVLFTTLLLFTTNLLAQTTPVDDYLSATQKYGTLYSGEIERYYSAVIYANVPYYKGEEYSTGEIQTHSNTYPDQRMRLDLYREQLIMLTSTIGYAIIVDPGRIKQVTLHDKTFIYLPASNKENLKQGYYMLLHKGERLTVLNKELCVLNSPSDDPTYHFTFLTRNYMLMDGKVYPVKGKRSLYKLFPQHKTAIKKYMKDNGLNWKANTEDTLQRLAMYCEELIRQNEKL